MQTYEFDYNDYKKRIKKRHNLSFLIMLVIIALLIIACYFIIPSTKTNKYYFVRINSYLTYSEASSMAVELQSKSAGGYIYFDGRYHVLANFYPNEEDANKVAENLSNNYPNIDVYTIDSKQYKKSANNTDYNVIKDIIECQVTIINQLYNCIINHDKNMLNNNQFLTMLSSINKDYQDKKSVFHSHFKGSKSANIINAYDKVEDIANSLENIEKAVNDDVSYKLKYELMHIVFTHSSFLDSL